MIKIQCVVYIICNKEFTTKRPLIIKVHKQRKVCVHKVEKQKQAEVESFLCGLCNRGLAGKRALNAHQQNKVCVRHVEKLKQAKVESLCSLCNRRFAANRHQQSINKIRFVRNKHSVNALRMRNKHSVNALRRQKIRKEQGCVFQYYLCYQCLFLLHYCCNLILYKIVRNFSSLFPGSMQPFLQPCAYNLSSVFLQSVQLYTLQLSNVLTHAYELFFLYFSLCSWVRH